MHKSLLAAICATALLLGACTGESKLPQATGQSAFQAINAIPTSPAISFLIEERFLASVDYKSSSSVQTFDDLDYTFNFESTLAGNPAFTRVASTFVQTERDKRYTFVISGTLAAPTITTWESDERVFDGSETVFNVRFAHTAESLGPIDVYFADPAVPPAAGQEAGTLSFLETLPGIDQPAGDYVVTITTAGNPGDVLYTSETLTPAQASAFTISVFDATPNDLGALAVRLFNTAGGQSTLPDAGSSPTLRFHHASTALATSDVYIDEAVTDQILAGHAFRDVSGDLPIASGNIPLTYTAAGDVGTILFETTAPVFSSTRSEIYIVGEMDNLIALSHAPDRRPIQTNARLSFIHTAVNHPAVDFYINDSGVPVEDNLPRLVNVPVGIAPITVNVVGEGDFDMYLTATGETVPIAGPFPINLAYGDVVNFISYDNVDPAIADLVLIPPP